MVAVDNYEFDKEQEQRDKRASDELAWVTMLIPAIIGLVGLAMLASGAVWP